MNTSDAIFKTGYAIVFLGNDYISSWVNITKKVIFDTIVIGSIYPLGCCCYRHQTMTEGGAIKFRTVLGLNHRLESIVINGNDLIPSIFVLGTKTHKVPFSGRRNHSIKVIGIIGGYPYRCFLWSYIRDTGVYANRSRYGIPSHSNVKGLTKIA
ncbi:hypothetical protein SDC9_152960 [bioreactor metagenome]|uniref:Uncharacterized protein n=1 Tax=bioreactor metagenome TaxID=1076179 RepID=A0A645EV36_9ZZZZ